MRLGERGGSRTVWIPALAWADAQIELLLLQELEFVLEENRVYRILLDRHAPHWRLTNPERIALAQKGKPLGQWLSDIITIVQPQTLLKWHCQLIAKKLDFSERRQTKPGRPPLTIEIEKLVVQFAQDNRAAVIAGPGRGNPPVDTRMFPELLYVA